MFGIKKLNKKKYYESIGCSDEDVKIRMKIDQWGGDGRSFKKEEYDKARDEVKKESEK